MDALKRLKRETITRLLLPILLLAGFGIVFVLGSNLFAKEPAARNLFDVPRDQLEGAYVTVDVEWIYGSYAYTETYENDIPTGEITEREYLIDANPEDYICMILSGDLMEQAEALLQECDAYYYGDVDQITKTFTVTGEVKPLPTDSTRLLREAIDYYNLSPAEQDIYLHLYIEPSDYSIQYVPLIIGMIFLLGAIACLVLALTGWFQKDVREKLELLFGGNHDRANEFMNHLMHAPSVKGTRVKNGCILLIHGYRHFLLGEQDLVWAYKQVTTRRLYGVIPIGKSFSLMLCQADGKMRSVVMTEKQVKQLLEEIFTQFPCCAIGYSDQLANLYRNNPLALRQVGTAQHSRTQ